MTNYTDQQKEICKKYGAQYNLADPNMKIGISKNALNGAEPIHGLRHKVEGDTSGWYIWADEDLSEDPDFFEALHVSHLSERCPKIIPYLGLPPGMRFLIASDHEDVWEDVSLLDK